ncbi:MAG TPA: hypothetical protein VJM32_06840 [Candidatus Saccharimonadales bacterium]|nr:hypothetical protein [Candidatus Saccharimonadales bacterium]
MKKIALFAALFATLGLAVVAVEPAQAINVFPTCGTDTGSTVCSATTDKLFGAGSIWNRILTTFTYIIGAISVLMIIIGGIRYVTSNGDQNSITSAKNTILYSVIGLIVAILAYAIVSFVIINIG